jgi:GDP-D-mannose 3',5'-epimerase
MPEYKKTALVLGAGGFIGSHMVKRLRKEGYWVRGVDIKHTEFSMTEAHDFIDGDLRDVDLVHKVVELHQWDEEKQKNVSYTFDEIYQFAADMGGAGYIFTGENDADVMHNSATINLNVLECQHQLNKRLGVNKTKIFYSSSACMYPEHNQLDPDNPDCSEDSAYPAAPDSEYGWEKLFSERLYFAYSRNHGIPVRVARYHNIFGPEGTWEGGREKAPAAICRKVAYLPETGGAIEVWGDGLQTRSFLFIDECIEATRRLMDSDFQGPVNIGSEEMVTINQLVEIREKLGWDYSQTLEEGIRKTYEWIKEQIELRG